MGRTSWALAGLTVGVVALEVKRRRAAVTKMCREVGRHLEVGELSLYVRVSNMMVSVTVVLCRVWWLLHPPGEHCRGLGHGAAYVDQGSLHPARDRAGL